MPQLPTLIIPKAMFSIMRDEPLYSTYVGSSNLTINALNSNREWNLKVATTDTSGLAEQLSEENRIAKSANRSRSPTLGQNCTRKTSKSAATAESQADRKNKPIANHSAERHAGGSADESRTATQAGRKPCDHRFRYRHRQNVSVSVRRAAGQTESHAVHRATGADPQES